MLLYIIRNSLNGKLYVGQTTKTSEWRLQRHFHHAKHGRKTHLCNAIRAHGQARFSIEPLAIVETTEELDYFESKLIADLDSMNPEKGYNGTAGGEHGTLSDEVKRRIGNANKGRKPWTTGKKLGPLSAKQRKAIGDFHRGKKHSRETIEKRVLSRLSRPIEEIEESKNKISRSVKEHWATLTPEERSRRVRRISEPRWGKKS